MGKVAILLVVASAFLAGCVGEGDGPMKTDPSKVMNPGGNPANLPPQAQGLGEQQKKAGEAASHNMDEMSRQMNAARDAAGNK